MNEGRLVKVEYWVATYHGFVEVVAYPDDENENIIARAQKKLTRDSGGSLPFGYQRFEIKD